MSTFKVFVDAIDQGPKRVGASASNKGDFPVIIWELLPDEVRNCYIGKEYIIRIDEADE